MNVKSWLFALVVFGVSSARAGDVPHKAWAVADVAAVRWEGGDTVSIQIPAGSEVEVVFSHNDLARVRVKSAFGWVAQSVLTEVEPVEAGLTLDLGGPPSFR